MFSVIYVFLILYVPVIGSAGYYTFGKHLLNNYSIYSLGLARNPYSFFISLRRDDNLYYINDFVTTAPFDKLGFVSLGSKKFSYSGILPLVSRYIGVDFYNRQFSFGVFMKEHTDISHHQYITRVSLCRKSSRLVSFFSKDITGPNVNLLFASRKGMDNIEMALSFTRYVSAAFFLRKALKSERTYLVFDIKKIFKYYSVPGTRLAPVLGIYATLSYRPIDRLIYSNNTSFVENQGHKIYDVLNSISYVHPIWGTFSFSYAYQGTGRWNFDYHNNLGFMVLRFHLNRYKKGYSLTLKRNPLLVTLSRAIQDTVVTDRIIGMLSTKYFRERFEYFYSLHRQYILAHTTFKHKNIVFFSGVNIFFINGRKKINYTTGFNVSAPLQMISLSSIHGVVYFDKNANGSFDKQDEPLYSIKVLLDGKRAVFTDKKGKFSFKFVPPGRHKIYLDLGFLPAEIGAEEEEMKIVKVGAFDKKYIEFKVTRLGRVEGRLFVDMNVNNVYDEKDIPLEGCIVSLNGKKTWTREDGSFIFANVPPGSYTLKVEYCPKKVIPIDRTEYNIYVMPGDIIKGLDFPFIQGQEIRVKVKKF